MINLVHEVKEVELIIGALRKLPMEVAEDLVQKIRGQAIPQLAAARAAEAAEATPEAPSAETPATPEQAS